MKMHRLSVRQRQRCRSRFLQAGALALACTLYFLAAKPVPVFAAEPATLEHLEIRTRPIAQFQIGRDTKTFGPFEFVGGLEMTSPTRDFGALSAFRFMKPGSDFAGVADTGFWFFGRIVHDEDGRPMGVSGFTMQQMVDEAGQAIDEKWEVDAEGLDVDGDIATVGFERNHRIAQFRVDPSGMAAPFNLVDFLVPSHELRRNKGFETVTRSNADGPLAGALVVVSERSIDTDGNVFAAILEGPGKGIFKVRRDGDFDITDGKFLPNGDLLLLERRFTIAQGVAMRLRRIDGNTIARGKVADGPVLMSADMGYQIDNMEAMDVWRRADGALMVSLMSDDNHSLLERNLYLEFRLHED
jgi:hypothetical protein